MKTTYRGVEITHLESGTYQLGENEYMTLLQAMQAVDRQLDKD